MFGEWRQHVLGDVPDELRIRPEDLLTLGASDLRDAIFPKGR